MKIIFFILLLSSVANAESLNLGFGALTYHGVPTDSNLVKREITDNGRLVYNPEIYMLYTDKTERLYNFTLLKDCYDNWATYFGIGGIVKRFDDTLHSGLLFGLYVRETPVILDRIPMWTLDKIQIAPLPFLYLEKTYPLNEKYELSSMITTNIMLTQFLIGVKF